MWEFISFTEMFGSRIGWLDTSAGQFDQKSVLRFF